MSEAVTVSQTLTELYISICIGSKVLFCCSLGQCDSDWLSYGENCYKFNLDEVTWEDAHGRCKLLDADSDLLIVGGHAEQQWLIGKKTLHSLLIGTTAVNR